MWSGQKLFFVSSMVAMLVMACSESGNVVTQNSSGVNPKTSGSLQTWGALHNAALSSFHANHVPGDFPSHSSMNGLAAANQLHAFTVTYFVNNSQDTTGFSEWKNLGLDFLATWWADSVTRRPNSVMYDTAMKYLHNRSAVERVLNYLNDNDMASMSKAQVVSAVVGICDSLLTALALQSNVNEEIAFVQIAKSSAQYWNAFNDSDWGGPISGGEHAAAVIQADCGGYIYGWVAAVILENATTGEVRIENQWKRIGAGAAVAINASGGGTVKIANGIARWISGWF